MEGKIKSKEVTEFGDQNSHIYITYEVPEVAGIYLGSKYIKVHHSGEGEYFNMDKQKVLEEIAEEFGLGTENITIKLAKAAEHCTIACLDIYHTYKIYKVM